MKFVLAYLTLILLLQHSQQLQNLLNTDFHNCIKCVCHATTGCYQRTNCANYSMSYKYWQKAGHPTLSINDTLDRGGFSKCILDENCILNTIFGYINTYNNADCNCDGEFDCNDILKLHLRGEDCGAPLEDNCDGEFDCNDILKLHLRGEDCGAPLEDYRVARYNNCASLNRLKRFISNSECGINIR
ncbi:Destabilase [Popillia japonica]|uniref:lysozyme n=1 Tax=Popillia japonica TaxID=7064 RepID=A0AAW1KGA8_POPJA